nr:copper resistance system multicopper oxidase [Acinetobacter qingfengensis]
MPYLLAAFALCWTQLIFAQTKEYHLIIDERNVNINGKFSKKLTVNGQFPAPTLTFEEGDEAVIVVHNHLSKEETALHWHGLLLPAVMDGVPGLSGFKGIPAHGQFTYRFKIRQNGTYWYHAHNKAQEQDGLYGAFIVYPKGNIPLTAQEKTQQDYVVMLSEFHPSSGQKIMNNLKKSAEYYQNQRETFGDVWQQFRHQGIQKTWQDRKMWNQMRMLKTDLSDVTGYTFLTNGKTSKQNWTGTFNSGDKIRLRFINASAMSFFDVRIPNLKMTVVSADGQPVKPVNIDEFRIGTAETYDVLVEPKQNQYQIQAESIDRSGFALATLLAKNTQFKPQPEPIHRPRALLSMEDMPMSEISHQQHTAMQHAEISTQKMAMSESVSQHEMRQMMSNHEQMHTEKNSVQGWSNASTPQGLIALKYSDLQSLDSQQDLRIPEQTIEIRLGGSMERYLWTINGKKYSQAQPLQVKYGERVRLKFINDSMMAHPMHLHGMFVQLENGQKIENLPNKHTVIVPPNKTVSVLLTADELGEWALHCHLLYHMTSGMMTKLVVAQVDPAQQPAVIALPQGEHHVHH